jgi:uncharacterized protein HemX
LVQQQTVCGECGAASVGSKFCPDCGAAMNADSPRESNEATATKPLRWVAGRKGQPGPAAVAESPRASRLRLLASGACVLAVVGLAVGVFGLIEAMSANSNEATLRRQLTALRQRVTGNEGHIRQVASQLTTIPGQATMATVQRQLASDGSQLVSDGRTLGRIQGQVSTFNNCIPEIQTQLSGLSISWSINAANVGSSSFGVVNNSQVSHDCTKLLYGG